MGWWPAALGGGIAFTQDNRARPDVELLWGDGPADALGAALCEIVEAFEGSIGREPYEDEVRLGLEFALGEQDLEKLPELS